MFAMSSDEDSVVLTSAPPKTDVLRFLLVEDTASDAHVVQLYLRTGLDAPYTVERVETLADAKKFLERENFDLVLLDLTLPDSMGLDTFYAVFDLCKSNPIVILSGNDDSELAVVAVREGAQDYILKGELSERALVREVRFAIERSNRVEAERQLQNAREQIRIARRLQKSLYPLSAPKLKGFDIAGQAWAAEHACGDYFDFLPMQPGTVGIVVGDVSGHGLGPALKMVEARATFQALSQYEHNLGRLIAEVHRVFCGGRPIDQRYLFLTLFLARLDLSKRVLEYSSAGHVAFHLPVTGDFRMTEPMDYPVGLVDEMSGAEDQKIQLATGDIFVIPTDGFYEAGANRDELFGMKRMMAVVRDNRHRSAKEIVRAMYDASRKHTPEMAQEDDMAAIVIKVT